MQHPLSGCIYILYWSLPAPVLTCADDVLTPTCPCSAQFRRKQPDAEGRLREADFADLLLAFGGYPANRKLKMIRRVRRKFKVSPRQNAVCSRLRIHICGAVTGGM